MSKSRFQPEEIIRQQQGEAVCAGFAFYSDFLFRGSGPQPGLVISVHFFFHSEA
jgi:hypothetical protein